MDGSNLVPLAAAALAMLAGLTMVGRGLLITPVPPEREELVGIDAIEAHLAARFGHRHL